MIKDDNIAGTSGGDVGASFSNIGFLKVNTNLKNEVMSIQSPTVMYEVVKRLGLNVSYTTPGLFYPHQLYGTELPITIKFIDLDNESNASAKPDVDEISFVALKATIYPSGELKLSDINLGQLDDNGEPITYKNIAIKDYHRLDTIKTPMGRIVCAPNAYFRGEITEPMIIDVVHDSLHNTTLGCAASLVAEIPEDWSSIISLTYNDVSTERAEDIINTVIEVYNENWIQDKNRIAVSTSEFIKERLAVIEEELGGVDSEISSFKSSHLLPDVDAAAQTYFTRATNADDEVLQLNNRLSMARYIRNYLANSSNSFNILPANAGLENLNIETQISEYNKQLIERNNLVANSSTSNPIVVSLDNQLDGIRQAILQSIDNYIVTLNSNIRAAQTNQAVASSRLQANPSQARYLLSVERQQKVKESLYLFLLQKREENELSQAFTAYNSRIITPPTGSNAPISPNSRSIMLIAVLLGLALPTGGIYLCEMFNTKVRGRRDLDKLSVPFIGEIPLGYKRRKGLQLLRKAHEDEKDRRVVLVRKGSGNTINEAFRVIRTNLELMTDAESTTAHTIMITSANPGSGKTFISMNLATVLAIKDKKVVIIDLDLRKASLSTYVNSPSVGVSAYLSGHATIDDIMIHRPVEPPKHMNPKEAPKDQFVDVIPVGALPPNPAELLYSPRLKALLDKLRAEYDYVLLDCPPIEVVADAKIINRHSEMTVFVVRAGLLERDMLPRIQELYDNQRYHNIALILNGTDQSHVGSIASRYGYGYGYGYGYHKKED
jgi:capsular exopolysaccharide synthesis family protein